uniref:Prostaglandin E synthase 2 n=1 Tax=Plectus sambesii TaxID=2011161 RepID=A0A914X1J2_9BILA
MSGFGRSAFRSAWGSSKRWLGAATAGSFAYGSMLVVQQDEHKPAFKSAVDFGGYRLEYPEKKANDIMLARKIVSPVDTSGLNLRLYQYQTCPYCCKVRALLDYYGFSYEVVEVNPVTRSQIKFSKQYRKVPIVVVEADEQKQLNDSAFIVSLLRTFVADPSKSLAELIDFYPHHRQANAKGKETVECQNKYFVMFQEQLKSEKAILNKREEREWREWVDQHFVHMISPNVYRTMGEAIETFQWFSAVGDWNRNFPVWERYLAVYLGALAMYLIGKRLKKRHQITDERAALFDACDTWLKAIGPHRKFMGGNEPNLADLALYGAINSFVGCRAFAEMRENTHIGEWFDRMQQAVASHAGSHELAKSLAARQKNKTL